VVATHPNFNRAGDCLSSHIEDSVGAAQVIRKIVFFYWCWVLVFGGVKM
jgi:hypothetical protein